MNRTHHSTYDSNYGDGKPDSAKSPERLQHEVDEARERLGARLDSLSHRLSPGELLDQALHMAKEHGGEWGHNLGSQAKQNPLPLLLTGIGLSWLMVGTRQPESYGGQSYTVGSHPSMGDRASGVMDKAKGAMSSAAERARDMKERAGDMGHSLHDRAGSLHDRAGSSAESMRWRAQSTQQQLGSFLREQPVLAGSLGIAIGAALGAMLPHSRYEDEMMGDRSEEAKSRAMAAGSEQYDKVREKGREAVDAAKEKAHQASSSNADGSARSAQAGSASGGQSAGVAGSSASSSGTDTSSEYRARGSASPSTDQRKDSEGGSHPSRF